MGGEVSTDLKSSNEIEISWLVQVLLNFDWFWGSPWGWGVGGCGWGVVRGCLPHMCTCMHMHVHVYIIGNSQGFPKWGRPFAWNYHVYHVCMCMRVRMHVCMHMHACMCMCTCGGISQPSPTPIHPAPPTPRATGSWKHQNSISLELIEIIWFCLKIFYLWTFLNSYRL